MLNYGNVTSFKRKLSDKEIIDVKVEILSLTIGKSPLKYFHVNCKLSYKDNIGFHSEVKKIKLHHSMVLDLYKNESVIDFYCCYFFK